MNAKVGGRFPLSQRRNQRAVLYARECDRYLEKLQLADQHIQSPMLARFWLQEPQSSTYCAEVVTLRCGALLVHGDVDTVVFSHCSYRKWRQVLSWMGNHNYSYAEEKASIGGSKDARTFDPLVARADILEHRRHKMFTRDVARELWDYADDDTGYEFAQRVYALTGDCELPGSIGWCTGQSVFMAQAVLRKLLSLLGPESGSD